MSDERSSVGDSLVERTMVVAAKDRERRAREEATKVAAEMGQMELGVDHEESSE